MNPPPERKLNDDSRTADGPPAGSGPMVPVQNPDTSAEAREDRDGFEPSALESSGDVLPASELEPNSERRPRGKIGRLSKAQRDQLNFMLRDGLAYPDVIEKMGEAGKHLTRRNVGDWFNGAAYQQWLKDREWIEETRLSQEPALDLGGDVDVGKLNESVLQLAVTQLFQAFRHLRSGGLKEQLGGDPEAFARLVHALARACRETLNLQKYRDECAKAAAGEVKKLDPNRELTDREHDLFLRKVEDLFKLKLPRPAPAPAQPPPAIPAAALGPGEKMK